MNDIIIDTTCMVVVPDRPDLGDVFDTHHAAEVYITWLATYKKVQGTLRPLT